MAVLKYWDDRTEEWVAVAGMQFDDNALRVTGGRMTGPLVIEGNLSTTGILHGGYIVNYEAEGSSIDANIRIRDDRFINFGHSEVVGLGDPVEDDDLANRGYTDSRSLASQTTEVLVLENGWMDYDLEFGPLTARCAGDGMVFLQGVVVGPSITPGPNSPAIATLPLGMRPGFRRAFAVAGARTSRAIRVDIFPDGAIRLVSAITPTGTGFWVALHDVCFYAEG